LHVRHRRSIAFIDTPPSGPRANSADLLHRGDAIDGLGDFAANGQLSGETLIAVRQQRRKSPLWAVDV